MSGRLGHPRLHLQETGSTNDHARTLAAAGAVHGTLVTADAQTAGRGRQGRVWSAPPGHALLLSVILRDPPPLLPLHAAVAVAQTAAELAPRAAVGIKWPNDVQLDGRKVAGILAEGRPQEDWAVLGIGVNVALRVEDLPPELHGTAATLGLAPAQREAVLQTLLGHLEHALALTSGDLLDAWRARDVLRGRAVSWTGGHGTAAGVDGAGRLVVELDGGGRTALDAGEVHLARVDPPGR
ncbi:MAG: biotin--[acetyl-CoA-carboxylase] ligase [Solirubrobacterales bacterium]|nr:biotin--[acetyl-CoA-carboxylase] ligase [Solirubrobacterales bacterium]